MTINVEMFSRSNCHLCEIAESVVRAVQTEICFEFRVNFIDGNQELEKKFGNEVPVTFINGHRHDYFQIDEARFRSALDLAAAEQV